MSKGYNRVDTFTRQSSADGIIDDVADFLRLKNINSHLRSPDCLASPASSTKMWLGSGTRTGFWLLVLLFG
jgi:hypothetical protein